MTIRFWRVNIKDWGSKNVGANVSDPSNAHYGSVKSVDGNTISISSDLNIKLKRCTNIEGGKPEYWRPVWTTQNEQNQSGSSCGITYYKLQELVTRGGTRKRRSTKGRRYKKK